VLIGIGIYLIVKSGTMEILPSNLVEIEGHVETINENILTVRYSYNNIYYSPTVKNSTNIKYNVGDPITIYINNTQPQIALLKNDTTGVKDVSNRKVGIILIIVGIVILILSWVIKYFVQKNKNIATYIGGIQGINLLRGGGNVW
jgi:hypothetical protein